MTRTGLRLGLAAVLVLLAIPASVHAQEKPQGRLVDAQEAPVASAGLQFRKLDGSQRYVAVSRDDGGFFLTSPPEVPSDGDYVVTVRLGNRAHVFDKVTIGSGRVTPDPLRLPW